MTELWRLSATELAAPHPPAGGLRPGGGAIRPGRLDAVNPRINAVVAHDPAEALAAAEAVDAAIGRGEDPGPLAGVPVTVKVNVDQAGWATTNGLRITGPAGRRARQPGGGEPPPGRRGHPRPDQYAGLLAALVHPQFAAWRDPQPARPGHHAGRLLRRGGGGDRGGDRRAGHGTDIGGSIRYPAYACGIHGLRPTIGRVPAWNQSAPDRFIGAQLMAVSGPIARTIADLRLAWRR